MDPQIEFETLIERGYYIGAVNLALKLEKLTAKKPFQNALFIEKRYIFLQALQQAVENRDELWLCQFLPDNSQSLSKNTPSWFTKVKDYPDWCPSVFSALLKAQIICAKKAIYHQKNSFTSDGWQKLADETGFATGFVYELFHWLKETQFEPFTKKREVPVLLAKGYGEKGQAAYLVIEQVALDIPSKPYPHPIKMASIPLHDNFQKAVDQAFAYIRHFLISEHYRAEAIPSFRWWIKPASNEKKIMVLEGPSFYGAFAVGMLSLIRDSNLCPNTAITCDGNEFGYISEIGGLIQKCQAAKRQSWNNIIIATDQDTEKDNNDIRDIYPPLLLRVETIREALKYITSKIGFEVIDYLELVYKRWGQLPLKEVPFDTPEADFDKITKPMTVRYIMGQDKNTEEIHDWDKMFSNQSEKIRRCVIYGWKKVGKTRLLRHEGRKISKENVDKLKEGMLDLEHITIPIFLQCCDLTKKLKGETTFEDAIFAIVKAEYQINGKTLSNEFVDLIKNKMVNGQCVLLLDNEEIRPKWVDKLNQFARNYSKCRIIITSQQEPRNKKDDYSDLPLEITIQPDEAILELLSLLRNVRPYKGLQFFDFNDNDPKYFFGREKLTQELLNKVKDSNSLALLGNSGSGKSSVIRAGLLHQLKLGEKLPGSEHWKIYPPFFPISQRKNDRYTSSEEKNVFDNLARVFVPLGLSPNQHATEFESTKESLIKDGAKHLTLMIDAIDAPRVVLVIDRFEEIFTLCHDNEERQQFFECLLGTLEQTDNKLCLMIVMRTEFLSNCTEQEYAGLNRYIQKHLVMMTPMCPNELQQAITEPARKVGLGVEEHLIKQILLDMKGSSSELPLLQYALEQLWQQRQSNWLTFRKYLDMDGVNGALKKHADKFYKSLSPEEQTATQWIFQNLTQLGKDAEDIKNTSKQVFKQNLITSKYSEKLVDVVLKKLTDARLVVTSSLEQQKENH